MLFQHNGSRDQAPKEPEWSQWLQPELSPDTAPVVASPGSAAHETQQPQAGWPQPPASVSWSDWLPGEAGPATPGPAPAAGDQPIIAEHVVPPSTPEVRRRRRGPVAVAVAGGVLAAGAVAAGGFAVMGHDSAPAPASSAVPSRAAAIAADPVLGGGPGCDAVRTPNTVRGNGTGNKGTAENVILAFQNAYYHDRSGAAARAFVTPDASVSPAEVIDAGIATVPQGTHYCVQISPSSDEHWSVVIVENRPDQSVHTYRQLVTVARQANGDYLITGIGGAQ